VLTSGITAAVTWSVSRNSSRVELAKVEAENQRLLHEHREEERQNRQRTYHEFLNNLTLLFQILGTETPLEKRYEICSNYHHLFSGVILFGSPSVREAARHLNGVYQEIWPALEKEIEADPEKPYPQCWRDATADLPKEFSRRFTKLSALMHKDVTQNIANEDAFAGGLPEPA